MAKKRNQIKQMEFRICFEWGRNYEKKKHYGKTMHAFSRFPNDL